MAQVYTPNGGGNPFGDDFTHILNDITQRLPGIHEGLINHGVDPNRFLPNINQSYDDVHSLERHAQEVRNGLLAQQLQANTLAQDLGIPQQSRNGNGRVKVKLTSSARSQTPPPAVAETAPVPAPRKRSKGSHRDPPDTGELVTLENYISPGAQIPVPRQRSKRRNDAPAVLPDTDEPINFDEQRVLLEQYSRPEARNPVMRIPRTNEDVNQTQPQREVELARQRPPKPPRKAKMKIPGTDESVDLEEQAMEGYFYERRKQRQAEERKAKKEKEKAAARALERAPAFDIGTVDTAAQKRQLGAFTPDRNAMLTTADGGEHYRSEEARLLKAMNVAPSVLAGAGGNGSGGKAKFGADFFSMDTSNGNDPWADIKRENLRDKKDDDIYSLSTVYRRSRAAKKAAATAAATKGAVPKRRSKHKDESEKPFVYGPGSSAQAAIKHHTKKGRNRSALSEVSLGSLNADVSPPSSPQKLKRKASRSNIGDDHTTPATNATAGKVRVRLATPKTKTGRVEMIPSSNGAGYNTTSVPMMAGARGPNSVISAASTNSDDALVYTEGKKKKKKRRGR